MIHEIHIEDTGEIEVYRPDGPGSTTRIVLNDCFTSFVIVIPDGDILDEVAHWLMMASLDATEQDTGEPHTSSEF
jgi:hypothetical protein